MFKKLGFFGAPMIIMGAGAAMLAGCDDAPGGLGDFDELCGPCGEIATGDIGISGNAKLDGFFAAVSTLNKSVLTLNADFELGLKNLEAAFGLEAEGSIDARVDALVAAISAEVEANASAGLTVDLQPAQCSANVNVAIEAQAQCEVKAECQVDPGNVSVECSGSCTGKCEGECSGEVQCKVEAPSVECSGKCEGSCDVEVSAECSGTCKGSCDGECSAYVRNADGEMECNGSCSGTCEGTCSASVSGSCEGTCTGSCTADGGSASCEGEVKCEGTCEGSCEGGCTGEVTPPSADCDASADCQAQAKAQASASVECTPPSLTVDFAFTGDVDARGSFDAKMAALRLNAPVMIAAFAKYEALINGKVNGEVVFETAPIATVTGELQAVVSAGIEGKLFADIPAGKIGCVIPALRASVTMLGEIGADATASISAQAKFVGAFTGGFKS